MPPTVQNRQQIPFDGLTAESEVAVRNTRFLGGMGIAILVVGGVLWRMEAVSSGPEQAARLFLTAAVEGNQAVLRTQVIPEFRLRVEELLPALPAETCVEIPTRITTK